jgi:Bacterial protein of unknown function (DUF937)
MATNIVTLVMEYLTPDLIGRISTALGLNRNNAQTAIGAAVPALLAGFSGVAAQPGGAQKLVDAAKQQTGTLGSLANMIGGQGQTSFIEKGTQMLSSLLGGQSQTALAGAVGKFAGLGQGASGSLLGMLGPVVMGTIAQQQGTRGLDASGVANLLTAEKDHISQALPKGFGSLLGGTGLLDSLGGTARTVTAAGRQTAQVAKSAMPNWLYWLIPALAIAGLLLYYFAKPAEQVVQQTIPAVQSVMVGGLDIGKQVSDSVAGLRNTLTGITDVASAQAALPKLQDLSVQIDKVGRVIGQLSPEQQKVVAGMVNPVMPTLNQLFDKLLAIPGVAEILRPTIDSLKGRLAILTT